MTLDNPELVRAEYADESRLERRVAAWQHMTGPDPREQTLQAVAEVRPRQVLEVGCGPGWASAWVQEELGAEVVAVDQSERMVELARQRGVDARLGNVEELPFEDGSFDAALAAWMLYHVADLDRGLSELERVLRPGGRLVAVTNSTESVHELWSLLGAERVPLPFNSENGAEILSRHFPRVEARESRGTVTFADHDAAQRYAEASVRSLVSPGSLPPFEGELVCTRRSTIFVAEKR